MSHFLAQLILRKNNIPFLTQQIQIICTQLYGFKYSNLIQITFNRFIRPIVGILIATNTQSQSEYTKVCPKSNAFFFSKRIITHTGTCIMHQNEAGPLWITSLILNMVIFSLYSNVPPSNESMYPCLVRFCLLFFEPLYHCSSHFLVTGKMFAS